MERVEQYFLANNVETNKKLPVLPTVIRGKTYSLLRTLTSPVKPSTKTFDEIVTILQGHLSPKLLLIAERFRFHKREQREDESINSYVAEINKFSEHQLRIWSEFVRLVKRPSFVAYVTKLFKSAYLLKRI